jgi:hypothetical protein
LAAKLFFAAQQYTLLLLLAAAAWGFGRCALRLIGPTILQGRFRHVVPLSVGLGLLIVLMQGLAVAGWFKAIPLAVLGLAGLGWTALEIARRPWRASLRANAAAWTALPLASRILAIAASALAASSLLAPLAPPREWDELMYHLPHASQWASTGSLTVNEWLRYPWFPYNFNLLYAAALVAGNDVLPHLVHALAGWTTAFLVLAWARGRFGLDRALLATLVWLWLARPHFANAYIDLGVALFVFLAYICLERWYEERTGGWLLLSGFALGVAVGSKYQALALLPFFLAVLCFARPAPRVLGAAMLAFLLPCAYWYVRNMLLAGDPVAPLGGRLLGFTDWNLADYEMQVADLRKNASLPPAVLWPAIIVMAGQLLRGNGGARLASAFGAWSLLVWAATSRYDRYLLPAFPVLGLLAVLGWQRLLQLVGRLARILRPRLQWTGVGLAAAAGTLALVAAVGVQELTRSWRTIAATPDMRDAVLTEQVVGYRMWRYLAQHPPGRVYQVRLEDGIYYAPRPIWGDHFGPWRYNDYLGLDAAALRDRLEREGFDALLVHTGRARRVVTKAGFERHFTLQHQEGALMLFSLRREPLP